MENFSPAANRKLVASGLVVVEDKDARGHDLCDYRDGEQHHEQSPGNIHTMWRSYTVGHLYL